MQPSATAATTGTTTPTTDRFAEHHGSLPLASARCLAALTYPTRDGASNGSSWRVAAALLRSQRVLRSGGLGDRGGELARVELVVEAALSEERLVVALLHDLAVVHDQDRVGVADGREAMGDDE